MKFNCLMSTSSTRKPLTITVEADDGAAAAFACWIDRGLRGRPFVHPKDNDRFVVTDGFSVVKVQILSRQ